MEKNTLKTIVEIEELVKRNQIDDAISELECILSTQPENADARMLFGVCKQMQGETEVFCQVYRELAPTLVVRESAGDDSPVVFRWRQYCKVAAYLISLGIVTLVAGTLQAVDATPCAMTVECEIVTNCVIHSGVDRLKNLPRGVQDIKYENGVISSLVVVGKLSVRNIPRKFPRFKAAHYGREKAHSEAMFEFTRFLSTKCRWGKTSDGKMAVKEDATMTTGADGKDASAKASRFTEIEITKEQKAESARAWVYALREIWQGLNENGEYVWIGAWNGKLPLPPRRESKSLYNMGGRPMTKYNMGGGVFRPGVFPW